MRLSHLTVSGFKSFARTTTFSFPAAVSAIVGPNGSGKSNIAEAIRWVLGEQSVKALRGRRGEDLIFNGGGQAPRMGKASVALTFENRDRTIGLDFDDVVLERKIFRDGVNEYHLNGSQVRLKDIVELMARIGLGQTHHNIISQGEVDRVLMSSPGDRRTLLEEAIGLRLYQLRLRESGRKLEETERNSHQVEALLGELAPHVKFLKTQADKAEKYETVRRELYDYYRAVVARETASIADEDQAVSAETKPAAGRLKGLEKEIAALQKDIEVSETGEGSAERLGAKERELQAIEARRRNVERELGRIEGRIEATPPAHRQEIRKIEFARIETALRPVIEELRGTGAGNSGPDFGERLGQLADRLEQFLSELKRSPAGSERPTPGANGLPAERLRMQRELGELDRTLGTLRKELEHGIQSVERAQTGLKEHFERLRAKEEESNALKAVLQRATFDQEKLNMRRQELERLIGESGISKSELLKGESPFAGLESEELKRKIEKLKIRLEEIGGIDQAILKEYEDTRQRFAFLEGELADLAAAKRDLRQLGNELEERIEREFQTGFSKMQAAFRQYVHVIFGGGTGSLEYSRAKKSRKNADADDADAAADEADGIDISVDIPRKRIKGLDMLSGGERALVSIALLFAITAVNPPPFLVLDETDAALDEANSHKYAAILKELSQKTQLILITHNRETMQQAGILYGVTMGENGISKILSLKLEEAQNYGNR